MRLWIPEFNGLIRYLADIERTVPGDGVGPLELDSIVTPKAIGVPKVRTARKMNWNWRVGRGKAGGARKSSGAFWLKDLKLRLTPLNPWRCRAIFL